jgi:hypothetical protein
MPSRLRLVAITPKGTRMVGRDALTYVRIVMGKSPGPWARINWRAVDAEGKRRGFWVLLQVWRERRGLNRRHSQYHREAGRAETTPPPERALRRAAQIRQQAQMAGLQVGGMITRLLNQVEEPTSGERRVQPGIFA